MKSKVDQRANYLKKILAGDMAFTNVLVGILMLFYESIWIVIMYDGGRMALGLNLGWDIQLISVTGIVLLTAPYLLASLFLASSMVEMARRIVGVCGLLIGIAALAYASGFYLETNFELKPIFLISRLPWVLFGGFVLYRLRLFKARIVTEDL